MCLPQRWLPLFLVNWWGGPPPFPTPTDCPLATTPPFLMPDGGCFPVQRVVNQHVLHRQVGLHTSKAGAPFFLSTSCLSWETTGYSNGGRILKSDRPGFTSSSTTCVISELMFLICKTGNIILVPAHCFVERIQCGQSWNALRTVPSL